MNHQLVNDIIFRLQGRGFNVLNVSTYVRSAGYGEYVLGREYCLENMFYLLIRCVFESRQHHNYSATYQPGVLLIHDRLFMNTTSLSMGIPIREGESITGVRPPGTVDEYMDLLDSQLEHVLKERKEYFHYLSLEGVDEGK